MIVAAAVLSGLIGLILMLGPRRSRRVHPVRALLDEAGHASVSVRSWAAASCCAALVGAVLGLLATGTLIMSLLGLMAGGCVPTAVLRRRRLKRIRLTQAAWPDVVDDLASAVRAGLPLPEAVVEVGARAPEVLRHHFVRFADDLRVEGRFHDALDSLKAGLADPVADRVIEALRLARDVGGTDLGRLLRDLSESLRAHARIRQDIEARQSWTVNSARLAVAAPWLTVLLLATRREAVVAFNSPIGSLLLLFAAVVSVVAYRLMLALGRLPQERRVLA
jgi:tight adherence protein B